MAARSASLEVSELEFRVIDINRTVLMFPQDPPICVVHLRLISDENLAKAVF